jgi:transposase-like protein
MGSQDKPTMRRYTPAQKDQAVRLVRQRRAETGEVHGSVRRVSEQLGYGVESVRSWVNQADIDEGVTPGATTEDSARVKALEQEVRELRRANAILRSASAFMWTPRLCGTGVVGAGRGGLGVLHRSA